MWYRLQFTGAKTHVVPTDVLEKKNCTVVHFVMENLLLRGFTLENQEEITSWSIDLGGSIFMDMPQEEVNIDGLKITIWSHQVSGVIEMLQTAPLRTGYYKMHHWHYCTVFTPQQRDVLINKLLVIEEQANQRADKFTEQTMKGQGAN